MSLASAVMNNSMRLDQSDGVQTLSRNRSVRLASCRMLLCT